MIIIDPRRAEGAVPVTAPVRKYTLVRRVGGRFVVELFTDENVIPAMGVRGYDFTGLNMNPRQRAELQGAPVFAGVCGPMWDDDGIRYECNETYKILST